MALRSLPCLRQPPQLVRPLGLLHRRESQRPHRRQDHRGHRRRSQQTTPVGGALPLPDYPARAGGYVTAAALGRIAERAFARGARDFIVPATDVAAIRRHARRFGGRERTRLYLPGIGALGGEIRAAFAAAAGLSTFAIVGRAIYAAPEPAEAARRLGGEALAFAR